MADSMLRRGIATYLVIAFGGAWLCWAVPLGLGMSVRSPLFQLAILPGGFAPAIAALVVRKWITREGFADAGLRLHLNRWRYYAVALILPYVVVAAIIAEASLTGLGQPAGDPSSLLACLGEVRYTSPRIARSQ